MGLGYNKINVLYPRPITLAKDICGFINVMDLTCLIKLVRFFVFNMYLKPPAPLTCWGWRHRYWYTMEIYVRSCNRKSYIVCPV